MFRASNFDKLLDKATSNLRLDPDWPTILQICDLIRQNDCTPKYAIAAIKKKLYSPNPHQAMFALCVLESIVKNCGSGIHEEVTSKAFCEMLRDLIKTTPHDNLKAKILELILGWAFAFRNSSKGRTVQDTVNILKAEGHKFQPLQESDAMFMADTAPEWADGEVCHRCRVAFSLILRRHHCRACGQVFCQQCSSKTSTLPKFGIEKEVRVCDACFDKVSKPPAAGNKVDLADPTSDHPPKQATQQQRPGKTAEELQEEEELQLALALSQSEAEHKEKEKYKTRSLYNLPESMSLGATAASASPTHPTLSASPDNKGVAPSAELSRYLDRSYWEQRVSATSAPAAPTAPTPSLPSTADPNDLADISQDFTKVTTSKTAEEESEDKELEEFVSSLKFQLEIFVNRMKSNSSRGRSIANDSSVQTLFMNITAMHSRLLRYIQLQDDKRVYYESLQDKISQIRDSRAALDTLRCEHAARRQAAAEAADRQRQAQMAAKLHAMRKKKHEYLQYQRQLALQRVQEQEREMQMRQEQQKHHYMLAGTSGFYMHPMYQNAYLNHQKFNPQGFPLTTADANPLQPQPHTSQANMSMNPMGTLPQQLPQGPQAYAMSTPNINQIPGVMPTSLAQQMPMPSPMQMAQMQMRMPMQSGAPSMMPTNNVCNGSPLQNGQPKQILNQTTQAQNPPNMQMSPAMPQLNNTTINAGMPMHNRMHMMPNQIPVSNYAMMPGQLNPMGMSQGMMPGQHFPNQQPPIQGSQVPSQNQATHGVPVSHIQGPMIGQPMPPHHMVNQPPMQGPQSSLQPQGLQSSVQPQGPQSSMQPQGPQSSMQPQGLQSSMQPQGLQSSMQPQGPQSSMQLQGPQSLPQMQTQVTAQHQPQIQSTQQFQPQAQVPQGTPAQQMSPQTQQNDLQNHKHSSQEPPSQQTQVKSETNNNTAELISFD